MSSIFIYSVLLIVFFWLPIFILRCVAGVPLRFMVYYFSPKLQLPFEMAICHFVFLSFLEKDKDLFGKFQFYWFGYTCKKLGLVEYLMPVTSQVNIYIHTLLIFRFIDLRNNFNFSIRILASILTVL